MRETLLLKCDRTIYGRIIGVSGGWRTIRPGQMILLSMILSCLRTAIVFLAVFGIAISAAEAQSPAASPQPKAVTNGVTVRDPFWPVGYTPPPPVTEEELVEKAKPVMTVPIEWPTLILKGLTKDRHGRYMAVVDEAGMVEAGSVVTITRKGVNYRWKITEINDRGLVSVRLDCSQLEPNPERNQR